MNFWFQLGCALALVPLLGEYGWILPNQCTPAKMEKVLDWVWIGELGFSGKFMLLGIISVRHRKHSDSVFCVLVLDFVRIQLVGFG